MWMGVNLLAVSAATMAGFLFGWAWYAFFGKTWARETGVDMEKACKDRKQSVKIFAAALILSFIAAFVFGRCLNSTASPLYGAYFGLVIGACWVSTSLGVNYLFSNRSLKLFLIDSGYHIAQFMIYGVILASWH